MADKIRVNTVSLTRTREEVINKLEDINRQIETLYQELQALGGMWEGAAHQVYQNDFNSELRSLQNLCNDLKGIASYEGNAITEYNNCENKVASLVAGIKV